MGQQPAPLSRFGPPLVGSDVDVSSDCEGLRAVTFVNFVRHMIMVDAYICEFEAGTSTESRDDIRLASDRVSVGVRFALLVSPGSGIKSLVGLHGRAEGDIGGRLRAGPLAPVF